jgi:hypothetical protein
MLLPARRSLTGSGEEMSSLTPSTGSTPQSERFGWRLRTIPNGHASCRPLPARDTVLLQN